MRDLMDVLTGLGVNLNGWILTEARAISADGTTIVGTGTDPAGQTEAWIATIPACGSADFNHDGDTATDLDIEDFFSCLGGNCCPTCGSAPTSTATAM